MTNIDMMAYLTQIAGCQTYLDTQNTLHTELMRLGVHRFHYVLVPPHSLYDKDRILFFQKGYENIPGFIRDFETYFKSEEAISYFSYHQNTCTRAHYSNNRTRINSLPNLYALLAKYRNHLTMGDALTVPVFGAKAYYGYFHMPMDKNQDSLERRLTIEFLCHHAHHRAVEINLKPQQAINLSRREKDVLLELVRGKKNGTIAEDLDISRHTVDAYIRRIFLKLDVNDRVTASLKATKLYLLEHEPPVAKPPVSSVEIAP